MMQRPGNNVVATMKQLKNASLIMCTSNPLLATAKIQMISRILVLNVLNEQELA